MKQFLSFFTWFLACSVIFITKSVEAELTGITQISAGDYHTCTLTNAGGVKCWGYNLYGQLGNNSKVSSSLPVDVIGLSSGVVAISAGSLHTCALTDSGGAKCWGANLTDQLGIGVSGDESLIPIDVIGLTTGVSKIKAGGSHTCAITISGGLKCWGQNAFGQLGDLTYSNRNVPVDVSGLVSGVQDVALGNSHTCAVDNASGVKCWGNNGSGQRGTNGLGQAHTPTTVVGLASGVVAIQAGTNHSCALTTTGGVKCWGYNGAGTLGDGTTIQRNTPVDVSGLASGVNTLKSGSEHNCVLANSGTMKCWGSNSTGEIGDGTTTNRNIPTDVTLLSFLPSSISLGSRRTCVITGGSGIKCWGYNQEGQVGDGTAHSRYVPVDVSGYSAGGAHKYPRQGILHVQLVRLEDCSAGVQAMPANSELVPMPGASFL